MRKSLAKAVSAHYSTHMDSSNTTGTETMKYANVDRYTGKQVGPTFNAYHEAQNALRGFRCETVLVTRKGFIGLV